MKLPRPLYQLPLLLDVERLQAEVAALPPEAWAPHPDRLPGNSAARLISAGGGETDDVHGQMLPTRWLEAMPYACQALAAFGVVWGRSRLMRLAPGIGVPEHADINYHWHTRVRMHIPIFTWPQVRFHCDGEAVHMAPGEAWIFDNWRRHHVENNAARDRIHLVADTTGTSAFWRFVFGPPVSRDQWRQVRWDSRATPRLMTEADQRSPVMPPAEVQWLVQDLRAELVVASGGEAAMRRAEQFHLLLENFVFDWRQLCALHGVDGLGRADFLRLVQAVREAVSRLGEGLVMRTNEVSAPLVFEKRILQHLIAEDVSTASDRPPHNLGSAL